MGRRIDYHQDPNAPAANSVRPSAGAFVRQGDTVLLICRSDNGNWSMPGGAHDPGESLSRTAVRETLEEAGVDIRLTGIVGIFTDPTHVIHYTSNDEVRQEFTIIYAAELVGGEPTPSSESTRVEWVPIDRIPELAMDPSQRKRIEWALTKNEPYIDPSTR
ncbi:NUDIX domain-containing protein [Nocardia huaxiensis]|uniref:NUDIX domain-containing protein n=1 Tax=Nocardia huaxiensis TaxID=2755382 RepID=A0A7D6VI10_9NOCA|nr:NUDIX domain-containing protein [Nocardia huaxiensis]QLY33295.1 NUDIX domain-containing protein [Nocardia huaxiensis]